MKFLHIGMSIGNNGHAQGFRQVFDDYDEIYVGSPTLNDEIMSRSPDLVFIQKQDRGISEEALIHLKKTAFVINWTGDVRSRIPNYIFEYGKHVDLTCFSNMNDVHTLRKLGYNAEFLQIGFDPAIYYPSACEKDLDVVFMGNNVGTFPLSKLRIDMVRKLKEVYGDRFKAFGNGMPDGNLMGNQPGEADIYRRAKIGINLSHFDYERYTSDRLFRMLGCGILVATHEYKGIYNDFNPHDFAVWNNFDELKQQIDYYLVNGDARRKIANNGHQKAMGKHKFSDMARDIIKLYEQYT